jgi:hypothetical protein
MRRDAPSRTTAPSSTLPCSNPRRRRPARRRKITTCRLRGGPDRERAPSTEALSRTTRRRRPAPAPLSSSRPTRHARCIPPPNHPTPIHSIPHQSYSYKIYLLYAADGSGIPPLPPATLRMPRARPTAQLPLSPSDPLTHTARPSRPGPAPYIFRANRSYKHFPSKQQLSDKNTL